MHGSAGRMLRDARRAICAPLAARRRNKAQLEP
jgi:hypothetical protein